MKAPKCDLISLCCSSPEKRWFGVPHFKRRGTEMKRERETVCAGYRVTSQAGFLRVVTIVASITNIYASARGKYDSG